MDKTFRTPLNLKNLRRYDDSITAIIGQSPHAVIYPYSHQSVQWNKPLANGTLFLVSRHCRPHALVMMNRIGLETIFLTLSAEANFEIRKDCIIHTSARDNSKFLIWQYEVNQRLMTQVKLLKNMPRWYKLSKLSLPPSSIVPKSPDEYAIAKLGILLRDLKATLPSNSKINVTVDMASDYEKRKRVIKKIDVDVETGFLLPLK